MALIVMLPYHLRTPCWLVLTTAATFVPAVPLPRVLLATALGGTGLDEAQLSAALAALCDAGLLSAVDPHTLRVPDPIVPLLAPLCAEADAYGTITLNVEGSVLLVLQPPYRAHRGRELRALLPQARAVTLRAQAAGSLRCFALAGVLGQALFQLHDADAAAMLTFATSRPDRAVPPDERVGHIDALRELGTLQVRAGDGAAAQATLARAVALADRLSPNGGVATALRRRVGFLRRSLPPTGDEEELR